MKLPIVGVAVALVSFAFLATGAVLAAGQVAPPPGDYQIDSEATTTTRAGPMVLRSVQRIDGATGTTTVEQSASEGASARQTYPGKSAYRFCVGAGPPPPGAVACANRVFETLPGGGSTQQAVCADGRMIADSWRRLADGRWERTFETHRAAVPAAPIDPRTQAAMAPVIAQIEATIRSGPPAEAEAAKQQLAALKASLGGGGAPADDTTVSVREVWTKVSARCA
ncbi:hypothetical protein [Caulobacter sp. 1776]|uniref:hypothetical protein n=1 Tax=Caulobacter sp. 1776 TaxID=3156420 RepID=UPI003394A950